MIAAIAAAVCGLATQSIAVQPGAGIDLPKPTLAKVDLGIIDPLAGNGTIKRRFKLRNNGTDAVTFGTPQLSCGCFDPLIGGRPMDGYKIGAGAEAEVSVDVDVSRLHAGIFAKYVWITARGRTQPVVTLELDGQMKPAIMIDPPSVRFARSTVKDSTEIPVKISIDRRLAKAYPAAVLSCSIPDVVVRPGKTEEQGEFIVHTFRLGLARSARIGVFSGQLALVPGRSAATVSMQGPAAKSRLAILTTPLASVIGEVVGTFHANPATVVFTGVTSGKPATRQVTVVSGAPVDPAKLRIDSPCKYLKVRFASPKPSDRLVLNLTFNGEMPAGSYDIQFSLTNPAGEKLTIPILAIVSK